MAAAPKLLLVRWRGCQTQVLPERTVMRDATTLLDGGDTSLLCNGKSAVCTERAHRRRTLPNCEPAVAICRAMLLCGANILGDVSMFATRGIWVMA